MFVDILIVAIVCWNFYNCNCNVNRFFLRVFLTNNNVPIVSSNKIMYSEYKKSKLLWDLLSHLPLFGSGAGSTILY